MISQYFGMKIYYDFSQFLKFFCKIYFEANSILIKVAWFHYKKFHSNLFFFFLTWQKEKVNKLTWYHPKLIKYKIIVQKDMKDFYIGKLQNGSLSKSAHNLAVHYHQAWLYLLNMMNTDLIMAGSTFIEFGFNIFKHLSSCCLSLARGQLRLKDLTPGSYNLIWIMNYFVASKLFLINILLITYIVSQVYPISLQV